ncbi:sugar kinase [Fulvivirga sp. 29W222]|uniref:Sugar kinase n=1 Tax=Fulvivirga marina TaxID=2494733 RepID=A0A937FZZ6_9BACT|nr:sugar kinase [Fulvivirga marina]
MGEVLLRLSTKEYLRFSQAHGFNADYGGSELNVISTLTNFGMESAFVTRLPDNDIGDCALAQIHQHKISTDHIVRGGDRMGIYFLEKGASLRGSKVVYDRAFSSFCTIGKGMVDWKAVFKDAGWFHWSGITAGVSQGAADLCMEAIEEANQMGLTISTDFNYRANLWNYGKSPSEIMEKMVAMCDVVLAGDYASKQYFGIEPSGNTEQTRQVSLCQELIRKFPKVKKVAVTNRGTINALHNTWSAVLYSGKQLYNSKPYDITYIVDRIGAGDSFMGALIYGLCHFDEQRALDFAVAASCLKHTIYGDTNLVSKEEVLSLMAGNNSGHVKR